MISKYLNEWGFGFIVTFFYYLSIALSWVGLKDKPKTKEEFKEEFYRGKSKEEIDDEVESLSYIGAKDLICDEIKEELLEDYEMLDLSDNQSVFDYVDNLLNDFDGEPKDHTVRAIKHIRSKTSLGLKEAKGLMDCYLLQDQAS